MANDAPDLVNGGITSAEVVRVWAEPYPYGCEYLIPLGAKLRSQAILQEGRDRLDRNEG